MATFLNIGENICILYAVCFQGAIISLHWACNNYDAVKMQLDLT